MPRSIAAWVAAAALLVPARAPAEPRPDDPVRALLGGLSARCLGPATTGGRVVDLAVVDRTPDTFYVGVAGGGVWKTTDGGKTLVPVFDDQPTLSVGAVAVCQGKPDVVYVGTGEANPRNSVSPGNGVYRSTDGGQTWARCGLADTHHVSRIAVHPENPDVAYVAALGHVWGPNSERGLYKTTDGGKSWTLAKFIDADTGFVDVCMDPADPETLYACAWPVRRDGFAGGNPVTQTGPGGGIFKTTDGGKTWAKLRGGLPERPYGRCGVSVCRKNPKVVYAVVQTDRTLALTNMGQPPTPPTKDGKPGATGPAGTGGVFRSTDAGQTWRKVNDLVPRAFYYGQVRADPTAEDRVYVLGVQFFASTDGGATLTAINRPGLHLDHHALWIDPANPDRLLLGNDGGLYDSADRGKTFAHLRGLVIGQFYGVAVDTRTPYRVYGGLQDNGTWGAPVATRFADGITPDDWRRIVGGDGFQVAVDPTDPETVYAETQFGALLRLSLAGPKTTAKAIRPLPPKGLPLYRFNWSAPIRLSPHDPKTVYYGGEYVFRSTTRGDTWERISPDLTRTPRLFPPRPFAHTITTVGESPARAGVLWAGTDDGRVCVSRDAGKMWTDVSEKVPGVPAARWVTRVEPSPTAEGTAFLAIDRHRQDDFAPYLFKTTDHGQTWAPLAAGLPPGATVNVVRQSDRNPNLLFVGTELGLFASLDCGVNWHHLNRTGLPGCVRVDDVVVHPRERELVIGTHGRGVWVMDVAPLEQLSDSVVKADAHLFDPKPVTVLRPRTRLLPASPGYTAPNPPPGLGVEVWTSGRAGARVGVSVAPPDPKADRVVVYPEATRKLGLHHVRFDPTDLGGMPPGEYTVTLLLDDKPAATKKVTVKWAE